MFIVGFLFGFFWLLVWGLRLVLDIVDVVEMMLGMMEVENVVDLGLFVRMVLEVVVVFEVKIVLEVKVVLFFVRGGFWVFEVGGGVLVVGIIFGCDEIIVEEIVMVVVEGLFGGRVLIVLLMMVCVSVINWLFVMVFIWIVKLFLGLMLICCFFVLIDWFFLCWEGCLLCLLYGLIISYL